MIDTTVNSNEIKNSLRCPNCGEIVHEICLTSNPPLYEIMPCASCGFSYNYSDRFIPYSPVTQYELNDYFLKTHDESNYVTQAKGQSEYKIVAVYKCELCNEVIYYELDIVNNVDIDNLDIQSNGDIITKEGNIIKGKVLHQCDLENKHAGVANLVGIQYIQ